MPEFPGVRCSCFEFSESNTNYKGGPSGSVSSVKRLDFIQELLCVAACPRDVCPEAQTGTRTEVQREVWTRAQAGVRSEARAGSRTEVKGSGRTEAGAVPGPAHNSVPGSRPRPQPKQGPTQSLIRTAAGVRWDRSRCRSERMDRREEPSVRRARTQTRPRAPDPSALRAGPSFPMLLPAWEPPFTHRTRDVESSSLRSWRCGSVLGVPCRPDRWGKCPLRAFSLPTQESLRGMRPLHPRPHLRTFPIVTGGAWRQR